MISPLGKDINIVLGYYCNYRCRHCISSSGPAAKNTQLTDDEIKALSATISKELPDSLLFTGGEPTLFPEIINQLVKAHPQPEHLKVKVTSNGWYGITERMTIDTLSKIEKLDVLQMSFDIFHGNESKFEYVANLANYCAENQIEFNISMCLSDPMDLVKAQKIVKDLKIDVVFQPAITTGRATEYKIGFKYPSFEPEALSKRCPNIGGVSYIPKKGFSTCCNSLVYGKRTMNVLHPTISEHQTSEFYTDISTLTMGEIAKKHNVDVSNLDPSLSNVCNLCEHIHSKAGY